MTPEEFEHIRGELLKRDERRRAKIAAAKAAATAADYGSRGKKRVEDGPTLP